MSPDEWKIVGDIKLRSPAYSFAYNPFNGFIYTAQAGGLGKDVDNVVGEIDPMGLKVRRYIELKYPNPSQIVVNNNEVFVLHGYMLGNREGKNRNFVGTVIDLNNKDELSQFEVPGAPGRIRLFRGHIYSSTMIGVAGNLRDELVSLNTSTRTTSKINLGAYSSLNPIVFDDLGNGYGVLYGRGVDNDSNKPFNTHTILVFDPGRQAVKNKISLQHLSLKGAPQELAWDDGRLFVSYYNSGSMEGESLVVIDTGTGQTIAVLHGFDEPFRILTNGDKLYVAHYRPQKLSVVDLKSFKLIAEVKLDDRPYDILYIE